MNSKRRGFTIAELLAVIFIIGILVAAATPSASKLYKQSRLKRRASEAVAYFRQARQLAVTEQTLYGVYIYQNTNEFKLVHLIEDPANPGQYIEEVISNFIVEEPLIISSASYTDGSLVTFNSVGNPSAAGDVVLEDGDGGERAICINAAGSVQLVSGKICSFE